MTTFAPMRRVDALARLRHMLSRLDWVLVIAVAAITVFGLRMVDIASRDDIPGDSNYYSFRQLIFICIGVGVMAIAMAVDIERLAEAEPELTAGDCASDALHQVPAGAWRACRRRCRGAEDRRNG